MRLGYRNAALCRSARPMQSRIILQGNTDSLSEPTWMRPNSASGCTTQRTQLDRGVEQHMTLHYMVQSYQLLRSDASMWS